MSDTARQLVFDLAALTSDLRKHLERKQEVLTSEQVEDLGKSLSEEGLILQRIKRKQKSLDTELRQLGKLSAEGGYSDWLQEIYPECSPEQQEQLTRMAEDTIVCQEMQVSQQELLRRSLVYYESMSRFLSGVQEWTYKK
ncbi:MAG: flagellar export chaperone FlgN [Symbiobacteriaceae bacterium]|nr:flagellar export chaperone FlgN [Symbiobacteriaceae bacterium]